jgi:hypothetical protein
MRCPMLIQYAGATRVMRTGRRGRARNLAARRYRAAAAARSKGRNASLMAHSAPPVSLRPRASRYMMSGGVLLISRYGTLRP